MSLPLLLGLALAFVVIFSLVFRLTAEHSPHRHGRHRLHRPFPYHDPLRHLIAPAAARRRSHR